MQGRKIVQGELQFIDIMSLLSMQYKNNSVMFAEVELNFHSYHLTKFTT